jgi:hypothetical protein
MNPIRTSCVVCGKPFTAHEGPRQRYWRCEHFPSAIENFFELHDCLCRDSKLEPWHNGTHRG